jgi:LmbE family N-acetylglucosaminyl deacetylase
MGIPSRSTTVFLMLKQLYKFFAVFAFGVLCLPAFAQAPSPIEELTLDPTDRILVLAPHPDDEVLGAGGVIQRAASMGLPLKIIFLTYGDSNEWSFMLYRKRLVIVPKAVQSMGLVRKDEAIAASHLLGVKEPQMMFLGYPDFGTLAIWQKHWNERPPYRSLLTWAKSVPYQGALRPGAPFKGEEILADIRLILKEFKPTKIFVSHPSDHNVDHMAFYLFTKVALWDERMEDQVKVYPYLTHYFSWPRSKGFKEDQWMAPPEQLSDVNQWFQFHLTPQEAAIKKAALRAHKTQYAANTKYLLSFMRENEIFGDFKAMTLHPQEGASIFKAHRKYVPSSDFPEGLNSRERFYFVGIEWRFVRWEGKDLVVSIELSKPLAPNVEAFFYIFGYSQNTPFKEMPKISLRLGEASYTLYDQARRIDQDLIRVKRTDKAITLTVPLDVLGNPDKVLTSARTYLDNVPLDSASWIAVELE